MNTANASAIPVKEFDAEMQTTRKLLERVPTGHDDFKPHEKSMAFGYLSRLVSVMPGWIAATLREGAIDLGAQPAIAKDAAPSMLEAFDSGVRDAREALEQVTGDALDASWSLKHGDRVLMTMPRGEAARQHLNHLIHHRGQLSVYERMIDVPIPSIYGPTADEPWSR